MPTIKFERVVRDCEYNRRAATEPASDRLIYDFNVMIDGEHRATIKSNGSSRRGYYIADSDGYGLDVSRKDAHGRMLAGRYVASVDTKAKFQSEIEQLLADGLIPTSARMIEIRAEKAAAEQKAAAFKAEEDRLHRARRAGPKLLEAVHEAIKYFDAQSGSPRLAPVGRANLYKMLVAAADEAK